MTADQAKWVPLDDVLDRIGRGAFHTRLLMVCGLGFAAGGMEIILMGYLMAELHKDPSFKLDRYTLGWLVTLTSASELFSGPLWGILADRYGRRMVFVVTSFLVASNALMSVAHSLFSFIIIRSIVCFGIGGNLSVDFTLLTEFLPTDGRAFYLFAMGAFWPVGELMTTAFAFLIIPHYGWRPFVVACAVPSLLTLLLRPCFPESPRWLVLQGRREEATSVCCQIAEANGLLASDVGLTEGTLVCIDKMSPESDTVWSSLAAIFSAELRSTTYGLLFLMLQCHVAGYFMTLAPSLIDSKGAEEDNKYVSMLGAACLGLAGVSLAMLTSSYFGRLIPMKLCSVLLSLVTLSFILAQSDRAIVLCMSAIGFVVEFSYSLANTYTPEAYPTEIRASGTGALRSLAKLMSLAIPTSAAYIIDHFGLEGYCVATATCCLVSSVGTCMFLQTETHGKNLQDFKTPQTSGRELETELVEKLAAE